MLYGEGQEIRGQEAGFALLVPGWKEGGRGRCRKCGNNKLIHRRKP